MSSPKVSIITACYNGVKYIERWKNSILNQIYNNIEVFVIDDGSTDKSGELLSSLEVEFSARGYKYCFFSQENSGVASAVNVGLRNMTGDYFMNFDVDDILEPWCISDRVEFLEKNLDCGMVLSNGWYVTDNDIETKYPLEKRSPVWKNLTTQKVKENVFKKRFLGMQGAGSLTYMFRTSSYLKINPKKEIPSLSYAQDDMLFLLNAFENKCGYINKPSFRYIDCNNSLSKEGINPQTCVKRLLDTREAIHRSIDILPMSKSKKEKYKIITNRSIGSELQWNGKIDYEKYLPEKIMIYGAGNIGKKVLYVLKQLKIDIECIIDNDLSKQGQKLNNIPIVSLNSVKDKFEEMITVVAVYYDNDVKKQLSNMGLVEKVDFYNYMDFMQICHHDIMKKSFLIDSLSMR